MLSIKFFLLTLTGLAAASPAHLLPRAKGDTADDWKNIINGTKGTSCPSLAVIFARGTFDSGNIGVWVGIPFRDALKAKFHDVAFQGVDNYPADLRAISRREAPMTARLGRSVVELTAKCPSTKVVISGWSQGALCAQKSLDYLSTTRSKSSIIAVTTFGNPKSLWGDTIKFPKLPSNAQELSYCEQTTPDSLCTNPKSSFPTDAAALVDRLKQIWQQVDSTKMNADQKAAVADMVVQLPTQAMSELITLASDIIHGRIRRWLLTPEHFWYGIDGTTKKAANDLATIMKK